MVRRRGPVHFNRREFLKMAAGTGVTCAMTTFLPGEYVLQGHRSLYLPALAGNC